MSVEDDDGDDVEKAVEQGAAEVAADPRWHAVEVAKTANRVEISECRL